MALQGCSAPRAAPSLVPQAGPGELVPESGASETSRENAEDSHEDATPQHEDPSASADEGPADANCSDVPEPEPTESLDPGAGYGRGMCGDIDGAPTEVMPSPKLSYEVLHVEGSVDGDDARSRFRKVEVLRCYLEGLRVDKTLGGTVVLELVLSPIGKVRSS